MIKGKPEQSWMPEYEVVFKTSNNADEHRMVVLDDLKSEECPTSLINRHPGIQMLTGELINMQHVKDATGAIPYGPDTAEWPSRWHEAVVLAASEDYRYDKARDLVRDSTR